MPSGKGTYGTTRGRPPKKKAVTKISGLSKKKHDADKARTNSFLKQVDDMGPAASKFLINRIIKNPAITGVDFQKEIFGFVINNSSEESFTCASIALENPTNFTT